jgi:hypothetical protein
VSSCADGNQNLGLHVFSLPSSTILEFYPSLMSGAGIAQWYSTGLWVRLSGVWVLTGGGNLSLHHLVLVSHPSSYQVGIRGSFAGDKAARAWSWPLTYVWCWGQACVELYHHSFSIPSWHGAELKKKHRENFTFILPSVKSNDFDEC